MTLKPITETEVEGTALEWLAGLGWNIVHGPNIAPDTPGAERADYSKVTLMKFGSVNTQSLKSQLLDTRYKYLC